VVMEAEMEVVTAAVEMVVAVREEVMVGVKAGVVKVGAVMDWPAVACPPMF
jgi:hypothetical protein